MQTKLIRESQKGKKETLLVSEKILHCRICKYVSFGF